MADTQGTIGPRLPLLGDASPWLHEAVSTLMATFSGEDTSFVPVAGLLVELDRRAQHGDQDAAQVLECVQRFGRLIRIAQRMSSSTGPGGSAPIVLGGRSTSPRQAAALRRQVAMLRRVADAEPAALRFEDHLAPCSKATLQNLTRRRLVTLRVFPTSDSRSMTIECRLTDLGRDALAGQPTDTEVR